MHRNDNSRFLLYIEPKKEEKLKDPIDDELTLLMEFAFKKSTLGSANYSDIDSPEKFYPGDGFHGEHGTDCGEGSDNHDYLLENDMIVNSLCVFYVRWYRNSIHENDWKKLKKLGNFYNIDIDLPTTFPDSPPSTKRKTLEENLAEFQNIMVDELTKNINKQILDDIKKMNDGQR